MLSIVLLILKIIGIIVVSILGFLLLVIGIVLVVPIRYRVVGIKDSELIAKVNVSWLLRIVYFKLEYKEQKLTYSLRIFGYTIFSDKPSRKKHKERRHKVRKHKVRKRVVKKKPNADKQVLVREQSGEQRITKQTQSMQTEIPSLRNTETKEMIEVSESRKTMENTADKKEHVFSKIKGKFKQVCAWFSSIKQKIRDILSLMKEIFRKLGVVKSFLFKVENRPGFKKIFVSVKKVLKHIFPTQLRLKMHFGTGDPCSTGQVLGMICAVCPQILNNTQIIPHFDEQILEGDLYAKGRIRIFTLLVIAVKLMIDKEFKHVLREFKNLKEEL